MQLHALTKITTKTKRRLGQGHGSGRVKTAGRGTKGQKARNKVPIYFEGGALPLTKRLPFLRGKGRNKAKQKPFEVNLGLLKNLPKNSVVDAELLVKHGIINKDEATCGVKILGNGEIAVPLTLKVPASKSALEKIQKAGGTTA